MLDSDTSVSNQSNTTKPEPTFRIEATLEKYKSLMGRIGYKLLGVVNIFHGNTSIYFAKDDGSPFILREHHHQLAKDAEALESQDKKTVLSFVDANAMGFDGDNLEARKASYREHMFRYPFFHSRMLQEESPFLVRFGNYEEGLLDTDKVFKALPDGAAATAWMRWGFMQQQIPDKEALSLHSVIVDTETTYLFGVSASQRFYRLAVSMKNSKIYQRRMFQDNNLHWKEMTRQEVAEELEATSGISTSAALVKSHGQRFVNNYKVVL